MRYFDDEYSAAEAAQNTPDVLELIAQRYLADNPPHPFVFHSFRKNVFACTPEGRFEFDLNKKFPSAKLGDRAVVEAVFWQENDRMEYFAVNCFGPVTIEIAQDICFQSGVEEEVNRTIRRKISVNSKRGWNRVRITMQKTQSGFGCLFGVNEPKWRWKPFFSNVPGEEHSLGFRYAKLEQNGELGEWLPKRDEDSRSGTYAQERIFKNAMGYAYAACKLVATKTKNAILRIKSGKDTEIRAWVNGKELSPIQQGMCEEQQCKEQCKEQQKEQQEKQCEELQFALEYVVDSAFLVVESRHTSTESGWGWDLVAQDFSVEAAFPIMGTTKKWLHIGLFQEENKSLQKQWDLSQLYYDGSQAHYFCLDEPDRVIRPVLENLLFGRWNYPLGVTLYGMMRTARYLKDTHLEAYVKKHIDACTRFYEYGKWDQEQYGYPEINIQLLNISMLDDCGSFANCMLEYYLDGDEKMPEKVHSIAQMIGTYITKKQERREDGAFYRICKGNFMEDTLWADDLYMSIPFLCRMYRLTKEERYLDDAVNQIQRFRGYLYMEDENLMSHVYDFKYNTATRMPWGRGNGWVFFSLSELLAVLPETYAQKETLIDFFRRLADGYMARQREDGMWPQLLDHPESYPETSCTAMFIYGLSRGVRFGWLKEEQRMVALASAQKGWKALTQISLDSRGNVYGVCEGSAYSFKPEYYTKQLGWVKNDPHGTGIVMLAGVELQMAEHTQEMEK